MSNRYINCTSAFKYCDWRTITAKPSALVEICKNCNRKEYRKIGRDGEFTYPSEFLKEHVRDFCQPVGATRHIFKEIYGKAKLDELDALREAPDQHRRNQEALGDEFKHAIKERSIFL